MVNNGNMNLPFLEILSLPIIVLLVSFWGIIVLRRNVIVVLVSIELMLLVSNFSFTIFSIFIDDITGQITSLIILTIAAAESAIGLAIFLIFYKTRGMVSMDILSNVKG